MMTTNERRALAHAVINCEGRTTAKALRAWDTDPASLKSRGLVERDAGALAGFYVVTDKARTELGVAK